MVEFFKKLFHKHKYKHIQRNGSVESVGSYRGQTLFDRVLTCNCGKTIVEKTTEPYKS